MAILLGDEHTLTITSDFEVGMLTTTKTALGTFDPDYHFAFTTTCVFPDLRADR